MRPPAPTTYGIRDSRTTNAVSGRRTERSTLPGTRMTPFRLSRLVPAAKPDGLARIERIACESGRPRTVEEDALIIDLERVLARCFDDNDRENVSRSA